MGRPKAIPDDVVDKVSYRNFKQIENDELFKNPFFTTSRGEIISLKLFPSFIRKKIEHLSTAEQEMCMEMKSKYNSLLGKRSRYKTYAYRKPGAMVQKQHKTALEADCIELLGKMFTPTEVVQILGEEYGVQVFEKDVENILKRCLTEVEKRREEYRNKVVDVRLYNKRSRLEELGWMYSRMRQRYILLDSAVAYNAMLRTLEQIRKEAEGDTITINGAIDVNVEVEIQQHIQQEIYKTINLKEIILGRVAARMGYDLPKLIAGLHNSYYSKFIQLSGNFDSNAVMVYPSSSQYDFNEIASKVNVNEVEDVKTEDVTESEKITASNIKNILIERIKQHKEKEQQRYNNINLLADAKRPQVTDKTMTKKQNSLADKFIKGGSRVAKEKLK
jgi:hypothetical protein